MMLLDMALGMGCKPFDLAYGFVATNTVEPVVEAVDKKPPKDNTAWVSDNNSIVLGTRYIPP